MAKILVVGGAGYVGSSVCARLIDSGHDVWVLDDLSRGHRDLVLGSGFTQARAGDRTAVYNLLKSESFDCVMHFAAFTLVGESVQKPELYWENNVEQTKLLLEEMLASGVKRFIFSSTCAIYGDHGKTRLSETLSTNPLSPYGETKLAVENHLQSLATRGLQSIALRYFNACGAEKKLRVGERHEPESHLIPNVIKAILQNRPLDIFGTDYPTPDGTCVRDYVHVSDLADAHIAAMNRLLLKAKSCFEGYNCGSEKGYSVKEIIETAGKVIGKNPITRDCPRRPGDPPFLVADSTLAKKELGFQIKSDLHEIIETAWKWELKNSL